MLAPQRWQNELNKNPYEVLPGFHEAEEDTNEGVLSVKFIIGRDLAVTRPPPDIKILENLLQVTIDR